MRSVRQPRGPRWLFFVLVAIPMFCVFPYLRGVNNPNEFVRVFTAISIVERHTFSIDEPVALWGWTNDMAKVPSKVDGTPHYFMVKAPGVVYCGVPGYFLFAKIVAPILGKHHPDARSTQDEKLWWLRMSTWSLRLTTSALPCFLFLLWFEKYLRAFAKDPLARYTAVAACALGTNYLAYVHMFASHSQYASLAFLGFALTEQEYRRSRGDIRQMRHGRAMLAGFCISACVAFEYQSLFLTIVLSLYAVWVFTSLRPFSITRVVAFGVGGLLNIPPVMYFHWRAYNNPFTPGHQLLETAQFAAAHKQGLWGILWPTWEPVRALLIDPGVGFFGMSPFMWIGLLAVPLVVLSPRGGPPSYRRGLRAATIAWWVACAALLGVNAGFVEWRGGWTVGPRYLVPCAPFFAFGAACGMERVARASKATRALVRGFGGGLCLASVLTIGTVGLVFDTLPESIQKPFAQFAVPMIRTGHVPHHVGEWFGWDSTTPWYLACGAMLLAPVVASLWRMGESAKLYGARIVIFVLALGIGMVPAFYPAPTDGTPLFVLFPGVRGFLPIWEPPLRDRVTLLRREAERYGPRRACPWYQLGDLDRVLGDDRQAIHDIERTKLPRPENCPRKW